MSTQSIRLELVTPEQRLLQEEVHEVVLPGEVGYFGVRPGHAPLLSSLQVGEITYRDDTETVRIAVSEGFAEVLPDRVSVLVRTAEKAEQIDLDRANRSLERARERIRKWDPDLDFWRARASLHRAITRVRIARPPGS